jgi:hypothetical protein
MRRGFHPFAAQRPKENSRRSLAAVGYRNDIKICLGEDGADAIPNRIGHLLRSQRFLEFVRSDKDPHEFESFFDAGEAKKIKSSSARTLATIRLSRTCLYFTMLGKLTGSEFFSRDPAG